MLTVTLTVVEAMHLANLLKDSVDDFTRSTDRLGRGTYTTIPIEGIRGPVITLQICRDEKHKDLLVEEGEE